MTAQAEAPHAALAATAAPRVHNSAVRQLASATLWLESQHTYQSPRFIRGQPVETPQLAMSARVMRLAFRSNRSAWQPKRKHRPRCAAKTRAGGRCLVRVELGKARCRFHGGLSTGPKRRLVVPGLPRPSVGAGAHIERARGVSRPPRSTSPDDKGVNALRPRDTSGRRSRPAPASPAYRNEKCAAPPCCPR
jgi:hypothetical protein